MLMRRKRLADGSLGPLEPIGAPIPDIDKLETKLQIQSLKSQLKMQNDVMVEMIDVIFNGTGKIEEENEKLEKEENAQEEPKEEDELDEEEDASAPQGESE